MKRILVATDGSECSARAIDYAANMAKALGAGLLIANVIGGHGLPDEVFSRFTEAQTAWLHELLQSNSASILTHAQERARHLGASPIEVASREGDVARSLVEMADEHAVDSIVVGKHGRSRVASLLLGSVAHKLVSISQRPVIVAP